MTYQKKQVGRQRAVVEGRQEELSDKGPVDEQVEEPGGAGVALTGDPVALHRTARDRSSCCLSSGDAASIACWRSCAGD